LVQAHLLDPCSFLWGTRRGIGSKLGGVRLALFLRKNPRTPLEGM
jgi:hypothetical protein